MLGLFLFLVFFTFFSLLLYDKKQFPRFRLKGSPRQVLPPQPPIPQSSPPTVSDIDSGSRQAISTTLSDLAQLQAVQEANEQLIAQESSKFNQTIINEALQGSRDAIFAKIEEFIQTQRQVSGAYTPLYDLLSDYPFRVGKMLRPTICMSVARAVGGMGHSALTAAAALELYHNAFLIHDDIEDESESRRGKGTLHQMIGIPRAINVGDATNVLAVGLLLENLSVLGVSKALNILHEIEFMARQSVEGQAMELDWVATNPSHLSDQDYFTMCVKKTCWYSFITPCRIGLIVGHPASSVEDLVEPLAGLTRFGMILGIAFQIQDDLLNLQGEMESYGKEIGGDIYEGKRTLMLNHVLAHSKQECDKMREILALPRAQKHPDHVAFIMEQMQRCGSIEHGWDVARSLAQKAAKIFDSLEFLFPETPLRPGEQWVSPVHDRRFLKELINYVIYRNK
ncbi:MAG: polyprenyl synthetase family protein [Coleofasciculus sp. G3-WIS-01]|uniref:polyprenyl synthetase family protein n=1 Tax=Coleofasciculus sp. G3-WIS-01 TaxID=3069528 RepID=UPI0032F10BAF